MICNKNCKEHPLLINDSSIVVIFANIIRAEEYPGHGPAADLSGVNMWMAHASSILSRGFATRWSRHLQS